MKKNPPKLPHNKKNQKKLLEESRARLAAIVHSSDDAIVGKTLEGIITSWNPSAERIFGYSAAEAVGQHITLIIPKDRWPEEEMVLGRLRRGESIDHFETVRQTKDGRLIQISLTVSPIRDADGKIIGASKIARDISFQKRLEEEFFRKNKMESIGTLAGGIAHDFNNILTALIGNLSLGKIYLNPEHKAFRKIEESQKAALQAQGLTRQLITFSHGGEPVRKTVDLGPILADWIRFPLQGSSVNYDLFVSNDLWAVEADESQINQVITNLVLNAEQAMPDGGSIRVQAGNLMVGKGSEPLIPGDYIKIQIRDQGSGISKETLPKIFDPFFTTKPNGKGLGLTSAYWIVKRHQGLISIDSELGIGTTATVYLPRSTKKMPRIRSSAVGITQGHGRILFMDDEQPIRQLATEIIAHLGYEVDCVPDGFGAIELFQKAGESNHPYTAVILDLTVRAGMGGLATLERLRNIDPEVRAIVSTGYSRDPVLANFEAYGFSASLPKPYTAESLSQVLAKVHETKKSGEKATDKKID
jgi:PAS domain S-box-containing protein